MSAWDELQSELNSAGPSTRPPCTEHKVRGCVICLSRAAGNCARCGHAAAFHRVADGDGAMPAGKHYCSDRHGDDAAYNCRCPGFVEMKAKPSKIYVIGSMKNPRVPEIAEWLRGLGYDAFDDWYSSGPESDDRWQAYEKARGRTFAEALAGHHAKHVFALDKKHLDESAACVLVAPAGKSGHLELGYMIGLGRPGFILLDGEPERFDVMYQFATGVLNTTEALAYALATVLP